MDTHDYEVIYETVEEDASSEHRQKSVFTFMLAIIHIVGWFVKYTMNFIDLNTFHGYKRMFGEKEDVHWTLLLFKY